MDLACVNFNSATMTVLTNNGSGGFVATPNSPYSTGPYPISLVATNVSGNPWPDLICANDGGNTLSVFTNNGSGLFALANSPVVGVNPHSVLAADLNGDGRPDLISSGSGANTLSVLLDVPTLNTGPLAVWGGLAVNSNVIYYSGAGSNVGINNANPAYALDVNGAINCATIYYFSDGRLKTNVATLSDALDKITALRGVGYDWRREDYPGMNFSPVHQLGFIAQEIEQVLPEAVTRDPQGRYSVAYAEVIPVLVEAVKEERRKTDAALKEKDEQIGALEKRLEELKTLVRGTAATRDSTNAQLPPALRP